MSAPERVETARLVLRRPRLTDAESIFARYASDADVVHYLSWPRHRSVDDTMAFIGFSDAEWSRSPAGPYLVESREDGTIVGGTGLSFETPSRAATGYVFAKDSWGRGYATEALLAVISIAMPLGVRRLYAICHTAHLASRRVLEKAGFTLEGTLREHTDFPNIAASGPQDVFCYSLVTGDRDAAGRAPR